MPWLVATALIHSAVVVEKRNALKIWTVLLSILAFSLSLVGTFLVRSGVLTSVHAFAVDPERGIFILAHPDASSSAARWRSLPGAPDAQGRRPLRAGEPRGRPRRSTTCCSACPASRSSSARSIRWRSRPGTAPRSRWARPISISPSAPSSCPCCCWCRSGLSWPGSAATWGRRCGACGIALVAVIGRGTSRPCPQCPGAVACALRHGAGRLAGLRRAHRSGQPHRPVQGAALRQPAAADRPAARRHRHDAGPWRAGDHGDGHHRHFALEGRSDRGDEAGRDGRCRAATR